MIIGPKVLNPQKFEAAKQERDKIIENAKYSYRFKIYEPPEIVIQKETYEWVDKQIANRKKGLDFAKSWQHVIVSDDEEMKKYCVQLNYQKIIWINIISVIKFQMLDQIRTNNLAFSNKFFKPSVKKSEIDHINIKSNLASNYCNKYF